MDKHTEELFKKLDLMYYQNKKRTEKYFREEEDHFRKIIKRVKEIKKEINNFIKCDKKEDIKINYEFYMGLHKELFRELYPEIAGKLRDIDVIKREELLNGKSVTYGTSLELKTKGKEYLDSKEKF